ncbi:MAG TPA: peptide-methionine (R)-S-oxide reductase [Deltaproteobacteria bacterium]|nr:peptide-methionine (R)-S-oxide reductase [Deltaproteobacteria bacterium]
MDRALVLALAGAVTLGVAVFGSALAGRDKTPEPSRPDRIEKTEEAWRAQLSPEAFHVLRERGTERPFSSPYSADHDPGIYTCAACGLELYHSDHKFDSGTGWPSFYQAIDKDRVDRRRDTTLGMVRTELTCARCGSHLGHVFSDGPRPTGERHCINGLSLDKKPLPTP